MLLTSVLGIFLIACPCEFDWKHLKDPVNPLALSAIATGGPYADFHLTLSHTQSKVLTSDWHVCEFILSMALKDIALSCIGLPSLCLVHFTANLVHFFVLHPASCTSFIFPRPCCHFSLLCWLSEKKV